MALYMMVHGEVTYEKAMEFKYGMMEQNIRETGTTIKLMGEASLLILMVMYMMELGLMIKLQEREHIIITMVQNTKDSG